MVNHDDMNNIKQVLLDSVGVIIQETMDANPGADPLEILYETTKQDIWLHFDSTKLFIFKDNSKVHIPINIMTKTPILQSILWLIESHSMLENIRNSENLILFRVYKGNSTLDCMANEIRNGLWAALPGNIDSYLQHADVWKFLIHKNNALRRELETMVVTDETEGKYHDKCIERLRVESTLKYFEELASRSIHSC